MIDLTQQMLRTAALTDLLNRLGYAENAKMVRNLGAVAVAARAHELVWREIAEFQSKPREWKISPAGDKVFRAIQDRRRTAVADLERALAAVFEEESPDGH